MTKNEESSSTWCVISAFFNGMGIFNPWFIIPGLIFLACGIYYIKR